jgi:pimeloyl-ACP methyl ester carboxylesterase
MTGLNHLPRSTGTDIEHVNATGRTPIVFIHGLWLLPTSWDRWAIVFQDAGYAPITPDWPYDPESVDETKSIGQLANHYCAIIDQLDVKPVVIGHSFGGLLTQIIAGRGRSAASVAIDPAPFRGVLPLPISALRAAQPSLGRPVNGHRAIPLTYEQFRFAFANAVTEDEASELYDTYVVPAAAKPIVQTAAAQLNPWSDTDVDTENPERGPLLVISGENDHTVPRTIARGAFKKQRRNSDVTEFVEMPGRGHALTIDSGWCDVAQTALAFVRRFVR